MEEEKATKTARINFYEALKSGHESYIQTFYVSNFYKTNNYIVRNNGTPEQARDIYQEAFIVLWRNIQMDKFKPQNEYSVEACLFQIAKNKWLDYLRSGHYKNISPLPEGVDTADSSVFSDEDERSVYLIREKFKELGDNCKEVLARFYFKKESMRSIAEVMGWTEATARNNKYRCIQKLRNLMK